MRVEEFLRASAVRYPDKTAIVAGGRRLSYAEFDDLSDRLAASLEAHGIRRGDRVLVFMDNCWEAAVSIFAALKAGAVFSPINPSTKADKLGFVMRNCRASAVLTQAKLAGATAAAIGDAPSVQLVVVAGDAGEALPGALSFEDCLSAEPCRVEHRGIDVDLAMLIYTSGSTGRPKGVMMTHRNMEAGSASITGLLGNTPDDIVLSVLPLSFNYGLYQLVMMVRMGGTLVLEKSFAFPQAIFETMRRERVTGFPLVPTMAAMIVRIANLEPGSFPSLRYVTNTAAALPPSHIAHLRNLWPDARIHSMYGLTECKRCTALPPEELDARPTSVGVAIPNSEAYIVDADGARAPHGETGELVIRGPHVMQGYWEDEEATNAVLRPGDHPWERVLHTGDLFRADSDGYLYFVGRKCDIIKSRGEKVPPREVEAVLLNCPGILEALVVGVPDPLLGHAIKALVVASDPQPAARDVIRHCAKNLEDYMVPKSIEFRDELPRTDTGKLSRRLALETLELGR
jgi:amino acid adenylation domain-containing protein